MLRLIGLVVSIGLADSLNPSTVGPALYLSTGDRPRSAVLRFTAGVFAVFFLGGCLLTIGPGQALLALVPHPGPTVRYIAETVVGAVMLGGSLYLWRNRRRLGSRRRSESPPKRRSPLLLGTTISVVELPSAFPYFAAIAAIVAAGLNPLQDLVLLALYNVCFVLPLLGIAAILRVAGDHAQEVLERIRSFLHAHWPALLAAVALVAGVFVTVLGVTGLVGGAHGGVGRASRRVRRLITHP